MKSQGTPSALFFKFLLGSLLLFFFFPTKSFSSLITYPYKVVCTVGMVGDIVKAIAKDKAQVKSLMGSSVDPHLYRPTRMDVVLMLKADIIFYSGLFLEGKMTDIFKKLAKKKPTYGVSNSIEKALLLKPADTPSHYDPHVWMDPRLWSKAAQIVSNRLSELDPKHTDFYKKNLETYEKECEKLYSYGKKTLSSIPESKRVLISSHDAFGYFGRAFGIKVIGIQGLSTESEAGLKKINYLVDFIVKNSVNAVFVESSVSSKNMEALVSGVKARGKNIKIGGKLFSDAMGEENTYEGTYLGMLDHNITTVAIGLGGTAPRRGLKERLHVP